MKFFILCILIAGLSFHAKSQWQIHVIDNSSNGADGVKLADVNNDGRLDIVTGWEEGGITKLYFQPETKLVKEKWPAVIVGKSPNVEDAVFADMNNDGNLDIVSCSEGDTKKIFVHWNKGNDLMEQKNWEQEVLPASEGLMMWMYAEPFLLDNRNGFDLVAAGKNENAAIGWFESPVNPGNLNDWHWHEISPVGWIMSILKRDMDGDGDIDIVISDRQGKLRRCRWLENPGIVEAQKQPWKNHLIGAGNLEVMFMSMHDMNGDNTEEAVVCEKSGQTVRIYEKQDKLGLIWSEKIIKIPSFTGGAKSIEAADMNNDGISDLVLSTETQGKILNGLIWLDGSKMQNTKESDWQKISGFHNAKYDKVELIDLDNDGDLDVLICEENFGENSDGFGVIWYENLF